MTQSDSNIRYLDLSRYIKFFYTFYITMYVIYVSLLFTPIAYKTNYDDYGDLIESTRTAEYLSNMPKIVILLFACATLGFVIKAIKMNSINLHITSIVTNLLFHVILVIYIIFNYYLYYGVSITSSFTFSLLTISLYLHLFAVLIYILYIFTQKIKKSTNK